MGQGATPGTRCWRDGAGPPALKSAPEPPVHFRPRGRRPADRMPGAQRRRLPRGRDRVRMGCRPWRWSRVKARTPRRAATSRSTRTPSRWAGTGRAWTYSICRRNPSTHRRSWLGPRAPRGWTAHWGGPRPVGSPLRGRVGAPQEGSSRPPRAPRPRRCHSWEGRGQEDRGWRPRGVRWSATS